jgi:hypothetical protein
VRDFFSLLAAGSGAPATRWSVEAAGCCALVAWLLEAEAIGVGMEEGALVPPLASPVSETLTASDAAVSRDSDGRATVAVESDAT